MRVVILRVGTPGWAPLPKDQCLGEDQSFSERLIPGVHNVPPTWQQRDDLYQEEKHPKINIEAIVPIPQALKCAPKPPCPMEPHQGVPGPAVTQRFTAIRERLGEGYATLHHQRSSFPSSPRRLLHELRKP